MQIDTLAAVWRRVACCIRSALYDQLSRRYSINRRWHHLFQSDPTSD